MAFATVGMNSWLCAHISVTPAVRTASETCFASSGVRHSGFSHRMCLPAAAAARIAGVCRWWGRQMSIASTFSSCTSSVKSV